MSWKRFVSRVCAPALLLCAACTAAQAPEAADSDWPVAAGWGPLVTRPCPPAPELDPRTCATLSVPEQWSEPSGRRIELGIVVLRATGGARDSSAVFLLSGGPGQAATEMAPMVAEEHASLRRRRDIVLLDQRGTGGSGPLRCDTPDTEGTPDELRAAATACLDRYRDSVDVRWYTTPHAAEDFEATRAALGYERIDLDAGSYGTRLALVYMKRHPGRVRSAVLRGVSPTDFRNPLPFSRAGQAALDRLFARCEEDTACGSAFPDLATKLDSLLERLAEAPVDMTLPADGGATREIRIGRKRFAGLLHLLLFVPELSIRIPYLVDRAHVGDLTAFATLAAAFEAAIEEQIYWGMQLAVVCPEDLARIREEDVERETAGTFLGDVLIRDYKEICSMWPTAPLPRDYWEPTRSDAPTLLISGENDPSTPTSFGETAARTLSRSRHVVIPGGTHIHRSACLGALVEEFLLRADPGAVDASCLEEHTPPPFYLGE